MFRCNNEVTILLPISDYVVATLNSVLMSHKSASNFWRIQLRNSDVDDEAIGLQCFDQLILVFWLLRA